MQCSVGMCREDLAFTLHTPLDAPSWCRPRQVALWGFLQDQLPSPFWSFTLHSVSWAPAWSVTTPGNQLRLRKCLVGFEGWSEGSGGFQPQLLGY